MITLYHHPYTRAANTLWMLEMESAMAGRSHVPGDRFSMADCIFGGTVRYMLRFKLLEPNPALTAYAERLATRPAAQRADARNASTAKERGLG